MAVLGLLVLLAIASSCAGEFTAVILLYVGVRNLAAVAGTRKRASSADLSLVLVATSLRPDI